MILCMKLELLFDSTWGLMAKPIRLYVIAYDSPND